MPLPGLQNALRATIGKKIRITFDEGGTQELTIVEINEQGYVHVGPSEGDPEGYWTRLDDVQLIEPLD